jgi:hypothetical protein
VQGPKVGKQTLREQDSAGSYPAPRYHGDAGWWQLAASHMSLIAGHLDAQEA